MKTILFFDDFALARRDHLRNVICHPQFAGLYRDPYACVHGMGCASAVYHEERGSVLLYYGSYLKGATMQDRSVTVVAESQDGIHFTPLNTEKEVALPERACLHQILDRNLVSEPLLFFEDAHDPDPNRRYKALTVRFCPDGYGIDDIWYSPDGIRFVHDEDISWHPVGSEGIMGHFYNERLGCHTILTRAEVGERQVYRVETRDWKNFSTPEFVMGADLEDPPLSELYGMPSFTYEDYVIGFPWIFHVNQSEEKGTQKFWKGKMTTHLSYSRDGRTFQRVTHAPFFENGAPGSPGYGMTGLQTMLQRPDGSLCFYCYVREVEHGTTRQENISGISVSVLRRDGFVCLESCGGPATLRTRLLRLGDSAPLEINLQCTESATCALLDADAQPIAGFSHEECDPFSGDSVAWQPAWQGRSSAGIDTAAIEIRILSGRIYAIRGDFEIFYTNAQYRRYLQDGNLPRERGF